MLSEKMELPLPALIQRSNLNTIGGNVPKGDSALVLQVLIDYVMVSTFGNLHGERRGTWKKEK